MSEPAHSCQRCAMQDRQIGGHAIASVWWRKPSGTGWSGPVTANTLNRSPICAGAVRRSTACRRPFNLAGRGTAGEPSGPVVDAESLQKSSLREGPIDDRTFGTGPPVSNGGSRHAQPGRQRRDDRTPQRFGGGGPPCRLSPVGSGAVLPKSMIKAPPPLSVNRPAMAPTVATAAGLTSRMVPGNVSCAVSGSRARAGVGAGATANRNAPVSGSAVTRRSRQPLGVANELMNRPRHRKTTLADQKHGPIRHQSPVRCANGHDKRFGEPGQGQLLALAQSGAGLDQMTPRSLGETPSTAAVARNKSAIKVPRTGAQFDQAKRRWGAHTLPDIGAPKARSVRRTSD